MAINFGRSHFFLWGNSVFKLVIKIVTKVRSVIPWSLKCNLVRGRETNNEPIDAEELKNIYFKLRFM